MGSIRDLTGIRFERLVVQFREGTNAYGAAKWNCLCDCGNSVVTVGRALVLGRRKSCGCLRLEKVREKQFKDLSGKRFSRLLVIKEIGKTRQRLITWLCVCDCGKETITASSSLLSGNTRSCGCLVRENGLKHGISRTREYANERYAQRVKSEPFYHLTVRIRGLVGKAIRGAGYSKRSKTHEIIGCDYEFLKTHIERQFADGMSWDRFSDIHIDHIVPLSSAKDEKDLIRLCHFTNIRPVWAFENLSKGSKSLFLI